MLARSLCLLSLYSPSNPIISCSIDCITKQGTVLTAFPEDGFACYVGEGYKCSLGKCRSPDGKLDEEVKSDLVQFEIIIKSALVADRDPYPTQGESDAFVLVEMVSGGEPLFKNNEVLCYTHVVQDNKKPRWNFSCKPQPMKASSRLRFLVLDSDKPDTNPQFLGATTQTLETLMNAGPKSITLDQGTLSGGPYFIEIQVKGTKLSSSAYTPSPGRDDSNSL